MTESVKNMPISHEVLRSRPLGVLTSIFHTAHHASREECSARSGELWTKSMLTKTLVPTARHHDEPRITVKSEVLGKISSQTRSRRGTSYVFDVEVVGSRMLVHLFA